MLESLCLGPRRLCILRMEGFWGRVEASKHLYKVSCHDFAHTSMEVTLSCISCCWGVARPLAGVQDVAPQVGMPGSQLAPSSAVLMAQLEAISKVR